MDPRSESWTLAQSFIFPYSWAWVKARKAQHPGTTLEQGTGCCITNSSKNLSGQQQGHLISLQICGSAGVALVHSLLLLGLTGQAGLAPGAMAGGQQASLPTEALVKPLLATPRLASPWPERVRQLRVTVGGHCKVAKDMDI